MTATPNAEPTLTDVIQKLDNLTGHVKKSTSWEKDGNISQVNS